LIPITRRQVKTVRSVFRAALGLAPQAQGPPLLVQTGSDGLVISAAMFGRGIRWRLAGSYPDHEFWLPFEFLRETAASRNDAVLLDPQADSVEVQWVVDSVPQTRTFHVDDPPEQLTLPDVEFTENPPPLLAALAEAAQTCDDSSTRYALSCIQLRGARGEIAATDGHQLLMQSDFHFPWDDDVLIRGGALLTHRELPRDEPVGIGRAGDVVVLRAGSWTAWLAIESELRFPDVDSIVPDITSATASVRIPTDDSRFLQRSVPQLPGSDDRHQPVTVDLNGSIAVRSCREDSDIPTELVLTQSERTGEPVRFCSDRRLLSRALQLGFERLHLFGPHAPAVCVSDQRRYVWMLLSPDGVVAPRAQTTRIQSGDASSAVPGSPRAASVSSPQSSPTTQSTRSHSAAMSRTNPRRSTAPAKQTSDADSSTSLIDRAESLRDSLQTALADAKQLIAALKQQKRTSKTVQSALKSLQQLEALDV